MKSKKKNLLEFFRDKFHFRQVMSGVVQFKRMFVWWIGGRPSTKLVIEPVSSGTDSAMTLDKYQKYMNSVQELQVSVDELMVSVAPCVS